MVKENGRKWGQGQYHMIFARKKWRLIGHGVGIHFEDIDEDISIDALLK